MQAEQKDRILAEEIRALIARGTPLTPEERVEISRRIRARQAKLSRLRSEDLIREARDTR